MPRGVTPPAPESVSIVSTAPRPCVLTFDQLEELPRQRHAGAKDANRKQSQLRRELLATGAYEQDLTHDDWHWKETLRAMSPAHRRSTIVGPGITAFSFCLLRNVTDANYRGKDYARYLTDPGERHEFRVDRSDGSAVNLHYHKNGSMDEPKITSSSETPPALPVGKKEAPEAIMRLLQRDQALDVTDEVGFPWRRYLMNTTFDPTRHDIAGPGIRKVTIAKDANDIPYLFIQRMDDTWCQIAPTDTSKTPRHRTFNLLQFEHNPFILAACAVTRRATESWMRV